MNGAGAGEGGGAVVRVRGRWVRSLAGRNAPRLSEKNFIRSYGQQGEKRVGEARKPEEQ